MAYLAVMTLSAVQANGVGPPLVNAPAYRVEGTGGPNIYLIMLDGIPVPTLCKMNSGTTIRRSSRALQTGD